MIWNNIYPADAHKLEQFRNVAHKSEKIGPPCFRKTSQHFGGTCKPTTLSKEYLSTKSLGNPALVKRVFKAGCFMMPITLEQSSFQHD